MCHAQSCLCPPQCWPYFYGSTGSERQPPSRCPVAPRGSLAMPSCRRETKGLCVAMAWMDPPTHSPVPRCTLPGHSPGEGHTLDTSLQHLLRLQLSATEHGGALSSEAVPLCDLGPLTFPPQAAISSKMEGETPACLPYRANVVAASDSPVDGRGLWAWHIVRG